MRYIRLTDNKKRDARVQYISPRKRKAGSYRSYKGEEIKSYRFINDTDSYNPQNLLALHEDMEALAEQLIKDDPEVDLEKAGRMIDYGSQVWIAEDGKVLYSAKMMDIVYTPEGDVKSTEDFEDQEPTVMEDIALPWTGKLLPISAVLNKFVLLRKLQICHLDGLTFDFLYGMAKDLQEEKSMLFLGGGPTGKDPLIFQRNGTPLRGFLEGRVKDGSYLLVLHLSNLELKQVPQ
ncbi:MAG TPA: hypothetical protein QF397_02595 [Candidatus Poseidoniia archaeon]|jgi:hypothetical protein|nr:hypothetical protein [Candidatus Poseidoniia archaeon]